MDRLPIGSSGWRQDSDSVRFLARPWVIALTLCCMIAIGFSGYLAWVAITSSKIAGCGGGQLFNCGHVLSSRWSVWMGLPVSLLAFASYVGMGVGLLIGSWTPIAPAVRYAAWCVVTTCALSAGLAAVWFISLQLFAIGRLCSHCLAVHTCGLVVAGISLAKPTVGAKSMKWISALSATGIGLLIGGQLIAKPPPAYQIETFNEPAQDVEVFEFSAPTPTLDPSHNEDSSSTTTIGSELTAAGSWLEKRASFDSALVLMRLPRTALLLAATHFAQAVPAGPASSKQRGTSKRAESTLGAKNSLAPAAPQPQAQPRFVEVHGGRVKLNIAQWPMVGPQQATHLFVEMFDYSCPHCRNTHKAIKGAAQRFDGQLAVVTLPVPLNAACNNTVQVTHAKFRESCELAKLAVSVWRVDAKKFAEFHDWMFTGDQSPTFQQARAHAASLVGAEKLAAEYSSTIPAQYIAKHVALYKRVGSGNVPKLMFPRTSIVGEFTSPDALADLIRREARQPSSNR